MLRREQADFSGFVCQPVTQGAEVVRRKMLELNAAVALAVTPYDFAHRLKWHTALWKTKAQGNDFSDGKGKAGLDAGAGIADVPQNGVRKFSIFVFVEQHSPHWEADGVAESGLPFHQDGITGRVNRPASRVCGKRLLQ